jgi:hypothetical protein
MPAMPPSLEESDASKDSSSSCCSVFEFSSTSRDIPEAIRSELGRLHALLERGEDKAALARVVNFLLQGSQEPPSVPIQAQLPIKPPVDESIKCWYTQSNYQEDMLGFGIKFTPKGRSFIITTDGNFISKAAFDSGLRQFPSKEAFDDFLPGWISDQHSQKNPAWIEEMKKSLQRIGTKLGCTNHADAVVALFPELLNTLVVEMMVATSDKRASEAIFQCITNIWRCFYYFADVMPGLRDRLVSDSLCRFWNL